MSQNRNSSLLRREIINLQENYSIEFRLYNLRVECCLNGNLSFLLFEMISGNHPSRSLCVTKIHWAIKIKLYLNEIVSRKGKVRDIPVKNPTFSF